MIIETASLVKLFKFVKSLVKLDFIQVELMSTLTENVGLLSFIYPGEITSDYSYSFSLQVKLEETDSDFQIIINPSALATFINSKNLPSITNIHLICPFDEPRLLRFSLGDSQFDCAEIVNREWVDFVATIPDEPPLQLYDAVQNKQFAKQAKIVTKAATTKGQLSNVCWRNGQIGCSNGEIITWLISDEILGDYSATLDKKAFEALLGLLTGTSDVNLYSNYFLDGKIDKSEIQWQWQIRTLSEAYPAYEALIPSNLTNYLLINRSILLDIIKGNFSNDSLVNLNVEESRLMIRGENYFGSTFINQIEGLDRFSYIFKAKYLIQTLSGLINENVYVRFLDGSYGVKIDDGGNLNFFIMKVLENE